VKILYVAPTLAGCTALQRSEGLQRLGHEVVRVSSHSPDPREEWSLRSRIANRLGWTLDQAGANAAIRERVREERYDILWVDKGRTILPSTLRAVREAGRDTFFLAYSPDDMMNPRNQSRAWRGCVPLYDMHVTTKSYNIDELRTIGAKRVFFVDNGFDPETHRPLELTDEERRRWGADVSFTGSFERDRFERMLALARSGVTVVIQGPQWEPYRDVHERLVVRPGELIGDDYVRAICATRINLCFLRKVNRDLQTTRTMEIPACGGFMLGERTREHLALFEEGKEAEFFESEEELLAKVRYYLDHEEDRRRIAAAGRERCLRSGYSNIDHLKKIVERIQEIRREGR